MESTTSELILGIRASVRKKMKVSQETIENLEKVLKQADLEMPSQNQLDYEILEDEIKNKKAILTLDSSIPVEVEIEEDAILNTKETDFSQLRKEEKANLLQLLQSFVAVGYNGLFCNN
jgi:signal recognition particle GTPase